MLEIGKGQQVDCFYMVIAQLSGSNRLAAIVLPSKAHGNRAGEVYERRINSRLRKIVVIDLTDKSRTALTRTV